MMTLNQLIDAAKQDASIKRDYGRAETNNGRFAIVAVGVGTPSRGRQFSGASDQTLRIDCYLNGKRVKRAVLATAMGGEKL